jgi:hypothetical protein
MQATFVEWMTMLGEWAIAGTILYEGHIALKEYRNSRLFDAIKYVEDTDVRKARTLIYEKLWRSKIAETDWWPEDEPLRGAAAIVGARYNLLGITTATDAAVRKFVIEEWGHNICAMYESIHRYIKYREESPEKGISGSFRRFRELYQDARAYRMAKNSN